MEAASITKRTCEALSCWASATISPLKVWKMPSALTSSGLATSGGMYFSSCLASTSLALKVPSEAYLRIFNGTPFKNVIWRALGVRLGRMVFDDGCHLTERAMAAIGDGSTLNSGSVVQCHSQEDGAFKSDRITIGSGCTLGVGAFVHYGTTVGDGAVLGPDSFLMKGEVVPQNAWWAGNPARPIPSHGEDERRSAPWQS